jgi:hypothetical protein
MPEHRSSILIWNSKLRKHLENEINTMAANFLEELRAFSHDPRQLSDPMSIPRYAENVTEIIKYKDIDSEVRCGRYYNSVWVEKKKEDVNFYGIPL